MTRKKTLPLKRGRKPKTPGMPKEGGAARRFVSEKPEDQEIYQLVRSMERIGRTEFYRRAARSYFDKFEWKATRDEVRKLIRYEFERGSLHGEERSAYDILRQHIDEGFELFTSLTVCQVFARRIVQHLNVFPNVNFEEEEAACKALLAGERLHDAVFVDGHWQEFIAAAESAFANDDTLDIVGGVFFDRATEMKNGLARLHPSNPIRDLFEDKHVVGSEFIFVIAMRQKLEPYEHRLYTQANLPRIYGDALPSLKP